MATSSETKTTTYHAVYVSDRPVAIFRYEESATGFCSIYNDYKVKHEIRPIIFEDYSIDIANRCKCGRFEVVAGMCSQCYSVSFDERVTKMLDWYRNNDWVKYEKELT